LFFLSDKICHSYRKDMPCVPFALPLYCSPCGHLRNENKICWFGLQIKSATNGCL